MRTRWSSRARPGREVAAAAEDHADPVPRPAAARSPPASAMASAATCSAMQLVRLGARHRVRHDPEPGRRRTRRARRRIRRAGSRPGRRGRSAAVRVVVSSASQRPAGTSVIASTPPTRLRQYASRSAAPGTAPPCRRWRRRSAGCRRRRRGDVIVTSPTRCRRPSVGRRLAPGEFAQQRQRCPPRGRSARSRAGRTHARSSGVTMPPWSPVGAHGPQCDGQRPLPGPGRPGGAEASERVVGRGVVDLARGCRRRRRCCRTAPRTGAAAGCSSAASSVAGTVDLGAEHPREGLRVLVREQLVLDDPGARRRRRRAGRARRGSP